ncbi:MAG: class I SAM-dependent methyltransferase [Pseudomonadota bacterium]
MSGFSADWLSLREAADTRSRSDAVMAAAKAHFSSAAQISICDLGSGTGASVEAFGALFPRLQQWRLVDIDASNLERAHLRYAESDAVIVTTRVHDLVASPIAWADGTDLVTATALFDLVSQDWLEAFVAALADARLPLLTTLTYDGRHVFSPHHPDDAEMHCAFDAHQMGEKSFGRALGPNACEVMIRLLRARGYTVMSGDSAWRLSSSCDAALIEQLLRGWAHAVAEAKLVDANVVDHWLEARRANTETLIVGHTDIFAYPGS